jgi:hypothetical protein
MTSKFTAQTPLENERGADAQAPMPTDADLTNSANPLPWYHFIIPSLCPRTPSNATWISNIMEALDFRAVPPPHIS